MKKLFTTEQKKAEAMACFSANAKADVMHVTVDGMCFTDEGAAFNHTGSICVGEEYKGHEKAVLREIESFKREASPASANANEVIKEAKADLKPPLKTKGTVPVEFAEAEHIEPAEAVIEDEVTSGTLAGAKKRGKK